MSTANDEQYRKILNEVLREHFDKNTFCVYGDKESAICLDKIKNSWSVYLKERNAIDDRADYDDFLKAAIDMIIRLSGSKEEEETVKNLFIQKLQ